MEKKKVDPKVLMIGMQILTYIEGLAEEYKSSPEQFKVFQDATNAVGRALLAGNAMYDTIVNGAQGEQEEQGQQPSKEVIDEIDSF